MADYATVNPSGNVEGAEIKLDDVLKHLKPFKLRAPFAWIVGGLAVHGKTKGDIDVLVRAREGELSPELWKVLTFRIQRALPPELAERVQFHTSELEGPITDNVPLYDLEATVPERVVARMDMPLACQDYLDGVHGGTEAEMAEVRAELAKAVKPAKFFRPMKPTLAAEPHERLTLDSLKRTLQERGTFPVLVQKKLDGLSAILWKQGKKVGAYSDDGKDLSNSLALADILLKLREHKRASLVLVGELEAWRGDMHLPRDVLAGIVHSKTGVPEGVRLTATFHDALYVDGDDLTQNRPGEPADHEEGGRNTRNRFRILGKLGAPVGKAPLLIVPSEQAADADAAVRLSKKMGALKGSEGALVKAAESLYKPGTEAPDWFKWRHNAVVTALVVEPVETKVKGVFNYHFGFRPPRADKSGVSPGLTRRVNGGEVVVYSGKTFSTDREYKRGDLIAIEATTVNSYPKTGQVTLWLPRVLDDKHRAAKAFTTPQVIEAAKREPHVLVVRGEKPIDAVTFEKRVRSLDEPPKLLRAEFHMRSDEAAGVFPVANTAKAEKQPADPFMRYPDEDKTWKYVVQDHWRGRSIHNDLRIELGKDGPLAGWTLNTQVKGVVKEPVETMAAAKAWAAKGGHSKIDWKTGEWAKRRKGKALVNVEIVSERKGVGPHAWLTFEGVVKPGGVGATKEHPGVLNIVDKGVYETGAQKPWFHEYFFNSSGKGGLNGRHIFRQLQAEAIQKAPEFVVPPAAEAKFREEAAWFFIKAVDQTPYVLSSRAISGAWLPPKGVSALPRAVRKRVPKDLRYWEMTGKAALDRRRELRKLFLKDDILKAAPLEKAPFVLQWHGFRKRGEKPVREDVAHQHYDVRFDFGGEEKTLRHWVLSESPLEHAETVGYLKRDSQKGAMEAEGEFEPGTLMNPTKDTRAFVKILDKGSVRVLEDDVDGGVLKVRFAGKRLKGVWLFERRDAAEWRVRKFEEVLKKS